MFEILKVKSAIDDKVCRGVLLFLRRSLLKSRAGLNSSSSPVLLATRLRVYAVLVCSRHVLTTPRSLSANEFSPLA